MAKKKFMAVGIFLAVILFFGVSYLTHLATLNLATYLWSSRIGFWLVLVILYFFSKTIEKDKYLLWPAQKRKPLFYLLPVIIVLAVVMILLTATSMIEQKAGMRHNDSELAILLNTLCNHKVLLIFTCLTAAFTEEFIFRGYMLPRLQLLFNSPLISIIISSLLFGLAHYGYSDINRMLLPFLAGIIFSIYYYRYRNLAVLIFCHFLMDIYSTYGACH